MPKAASDRQRAANRKDAEISTGPRTPKGKASSRKNTLKHGLLANHLVVATPHTPERCEAFDAFVADLVTEIKPRGIIEETRVERIAASEECHILTPRKKRFAE